MMLGAIPAADITLPPICEFLLYVPSIRTPFEHPRARVVSAPPRECCQRCVLEVARLNPVAKSVRRRVDRYRLHLSPKGSGCCLRRSVSLLRMKFRPRAPGCCTRQAAIAPPEMHPDRLRDHRIEPSVPRAIHSPASSACRPAVAVRTCPPSPARGSISPRPSLPAYPSAVA